MTLRKELPYHMMRSPCQFEVPQFEKIKQEWDQNKYKFKIKSSDSLTVKNEKQSKMQRFEWNDKPAAEGLADAGYLVILAPASLHTDVHIGLKLLDLAGNIVEKFELKAHNIYINFHSLLSRYDKSLGNGHLTICGQLLQDMINKFGIPFKYI